MGKAESETTCQSVTRGNLAEDFSRQKEIQVRTEKLLGSYQRVNNAGIGRHCFDIFFGSKYQSIWDIDESFEHTDQIENFLNFLSNWTNTIPADESFKLYQQIGSTEFRLDSGEQVQIAKSLSRVDPQKLFEDDFLDKTSEFNRLELYRQSKELTKLIADLGVADDKLVVSPENLLDWKRSDNHDRTVACHDDFDISQIEKQLLSKINLNSKLGHTYLDKLDQQLRSNLFADNYRIYTEHFSFFSYVKPRNKTVGDWKENEIVSMIEANLNIQGRLKMHQIVADAIATKDPVLDQDPDNTLLGLVKEKFMPWKRGQHISYLERWLSYAA